MSAGSVLRVCLVTGEYPPDPGGVADYTRCLAEALSARGLAIDVITTRRARTLLETGDRAGDSSVQAQPAGHDPVHGPVGDGRAPNVHRAMPHWGWTALGRMKGALRKLQPDIVHVQFQTAAFGLQPMIQAAPGWLRGRTGARQAITFHDLRPPYILPKATALRAWSVRLPARSADLTIATNQEDWSALSAWGVTRRLELVPIGSNVPDSPPAGFDPGAWRAEHGLSDGSDLLVYFGFLNSSKGGLVLLDALQHLRESGRDVRLVMLGGSVGASDPTDADYLRSFRAKALSRRLDAALIWTGHLPQPCVSAWLRAADAAVLPYADGASFRRGSLLAALTHGCPTVTTRADVSPNLLQAHSADESGLPVLTDGDGVALVPPGDPAALAAAVSRLIDSPGQAERMSRRAREIARSFGWEAIAQRHEQIYREIVANAQTDATSRPRSG